MIMILILIACVVEWSVRGSLDPILVQIALPLLAIFTASVTGERIAHQVSKGQPILPTNGIGKNNTSSNGG